jgi:hypothetical protein
MGMVLGVQGFGCVVGFIGLDLKLMIVLPERCVQEEGHHLPKRERPPVDDRLGVKLAFSYAPYQNIIIK